MPRPTGAMPFYGLGGSAAGPPELRCSLINALKAVSESGGRQLRGRPAGQPCAGRMGVRLRTGAALAGGGGVEQAERQGNANTKLPHLARRVAEAVVRGAGCEHILAMDALRRRSGGAAPDMLLHFREDDVDAAQREREALVEAQGLEVDVEGCTYRVGAEYYVHEGELPDLEVVHVTVRNLPPACLREGVGHTILAAVGYTHVRVEEYLGADGIGDGQWCTIPSTRLVLEVRGLAGMDMALSRLPRTIPLYGGSERDVHISVSHPAWEGDPAAQWGAGAAGAGLTAPPFHSPFVGAVGVPGPPPGRPPPRQPPQPTAPPVVHGREAPPRGRPAPHGSGSGPAPRATRRPAVLTVPREQLQRGARPAAATATAARAAAGTSGGVRATAPARQGTGSAGRRGVSGSAAGGAQAAGAGPMDLDPREPPDTALAEEALLWVEDNFGVANAMRRDVVAVVLARREFRGVTTLVGNLQLALREEVQRRRVAEQSAEGQPSGAAGADPPPGCRRNPPRSARGSGAWDGALHSSHRAAGAAAPSRGAAA